MSGTDGRPHDLAEMRREGDVPLGREILIAEDEDLMSEDQFES